MVLASLEHAALTATAPPVDLSGYGQYPLLQLGGAIATIVIAVLAYVYAQKAKPAPTPTQPAASEGGGVQVFLGGPVGQALEHLKTIAESVKAVPALLVQHHNELGERIRKDRSEFYSRIEEEADGRREADEKIEARLRECEQSLARLEGQQERGRR